MSQRETTKERERERLRKEGRSNVWSVAGSKNMTFLNHANAVRSSRNRLPAHTVQRRQVVRLWRRLQSPNNKPRRAHRVFPRDRTGKNGRTQKREGISDGAATDSFWGFFSAFDGAPSLGHTYRRELSLPQAWLSNPRFYTATT